jgi:hypothetical protein
MTIRNVYNIPTDLRDALNQLIDQCAAENGGKLVGQPSVSFRGGVTTLEVDEHPWWAESMRARYPQLVLTGVNRVTSGVPPEAAT